MEKITFEKWDPAEYINTKEQVIAYLELAIEENDPEFLLDVIGDIIRATHKSLITGISSF